MSVDHAWDVTPAEARLIQDRLAPCVEARDRLGPVTTAAGVDVHFPSRDIARAAVVVLDADTLEAIDRSVVEQPVGFPYVPGLLSFRELPAALEAFSQLRVQPDLILCDGQGLAHPRRFGLACHLGVLLDVPTLGVAKSRFIGAHDTLGTDRGSRVPLMDGTEEIGAALRTRAGVRPLFVSVGHRVSLDTAVAWVLRCTTRYRLPETTRVAHRLASGSLGRR
jgi:deoxyribonuclease V